MTGGPTLKPDADEIRGFLRELQSASWLPPYQDWWPKYIYHSNDVENVANVLNHGALLSRNGAIRRGLLAKDCASPGIIAALTDTDKDWVRLYFRPMAPTQWANEGIRPKTQYEYGAHMPVPVYLMFRSDEVLCLRGTCFTHGRLTRRSPLGKDADFLRSIPFKQVFHHGPVAAQNRDAIVNARHAEVLVKDSLSLDHLLWIGCRSAPERATLMDLLEPAVLERWRKRMALERPGRQLFYKRGTFVQAVDLSPAHSTFTFYSNISSDFRGPFHVRMKWEAEDFEGRWERDEYHVTSEPVSFDLGDPQDRYQVRVEFDGNLAYQGTYRAPTEPEVF
jgi:hypothetical protein